MLRKIEINNFKSFEHAEFDLKNFTLLAGRNSMGKTSVIQAIFAMIQNGKNPFRVYEYRKSTGGKKCNNRKW